MNTQPNELQMSDVIDFLNRLRQSEKEAWRYADELERERKRLHEVNQMLLSALDWIDKRCPIELMTEPAHNLHLEVAHDAGACARAALAEAKGWA